MNLEDVILRGTRAGQPAANTVPNGALYFVTDESVTERSTGAAWQTYTDGGSAGITSLTGDVTGTGPGATVATIANNAVTDAKLRQSAAVSVVGRSANSTGNVADIAAGANDTLLQRVGNALSFAGLTIGMFGANLVTYAKIQQVSAASRLLGRGSAAGAGDIQELTLGAGLSMAGTVLSASGTGGVWTLITTQALSGATQYDIINLSAYSDIRVAIVGATFGSASNTRLRVSTDNGGTYLTSSGDYVAVAGDGTPTNGTELQFMSGSATAARSGEIIIEGFNLASAPHFARSNFFSVDGINMRYVATTTALNAIRVYSSAGVNFTGGTAYVFGR